MISIVNYGMGNLGSIRNMLKRIGVKSEVVSHPEEIYNASKILLPGVGAFDVAMHSIKQAGLIDVLNEKANIQQVPILGICLGMQLLTDSSEEGVQEGLGWIPAKTISFKGRINKKFKIPHMGWNIVKKGVDSKLIEGFGKDKDIRFYFVHSYFVKVDSQQNSILRTYYGLEFDSAIQNDNIYGAQFHPEKSHKFGMRILKNFAEL